MERKLPECSHGNCSKSGAALVVQGIKENCFSLSLCTWGFKACAIWDFSDRRIEAGRAELQIMPAYLAGTLSSFPAVPRGCQMGELDQSWAWFTPSISISLFSGRIFSRLSLNFGITFLIAEKRSNNDYLDGEGGKSLTPKFLWMEMNLFSQHCYELISLFVQIRSRAKIEKIRASLFNSSDLIGLSSLDGEDELMEMSTEEILTVFTVNQSLFDTQGSPALEDYFNDKSIKGRWLGIGKSLLCSAFWFCINQGWHWARKEFHLQAEHCSVVHPANQINNK